MRSRRGIALILATLFLAVGTASATTLQGDVQANSPKVAGS